MSAMYWHLNMPSLLKCAHTEGHMCTIYLGVPGMQQYLLSLGSVLADALAGLLFPNMLVVCTSQSYVVFGIKL